MEEHKVAEREGGETRGEKRREGENVKVSTREEKNEYFEVDATTMMCEKEQTQLL